MARAFIAATVLLLKQWPSSSSSEKASCLEIVEGDEGAARAWAAAFTPQQLGNFVRHGELDCARELVARKLVDVKGIATLIAEAEMALRGAAREERELLSLIDPTKTLRSTGVAVVPALEWAQSASAVYLRIKWAHKIDAPATLDVTSIQVDCPENLLKVSATSPTKKFDLELVPLQSVTSCSWEPGSVGRIVVTLAKATPSRWTRLAETTHGLSIHTWWDRHIDDEVDRQGVEPIKSESREARPDNPAISAPRVHPEHVGLLRYTSVRFSRILNDLRDRNTIVQIAFDFAANLADGWVGDPRAFVKRQVRQHACTRLTPYISQAERRLERIRRNLTFWNRRLDSEAYARNRRIDEELRANLSVLGIAHSEAPEQGAEPRREL